MKRLMELAVRMQIWKDTRGQDLIEYALMAGFVAVAAGAIMPGVASSINDVWRDADYDLAESKSEQPVAGRTRLFHPQIRHLRRRRSAALHLPKRRRPPRTNHRLHPNRPTLPGGADEDPCCERIHLV